MAARHLPTAGEGGGLMEKTNAMRLLDSRKIPYITHTFSPDIHSALEVAQVLGVPAPQVYKTLVVIAEPAGKPKGKPLLVIIPGDRELDLKLLAQEVGEKKLRMATHDEAEGLTGLQVGGISALALLNRGFAIYLDKSALDWEQIIVSAGRRGVNLQLGVQDLMRVAKAKVIEATRSGL